MKRCLLLVMLLSGVWTLSAADYSAWDSWKKGYTLYERGEQQREKGDYLAALASFQEAKALYTELQQKRPDWNQKIITGRISDCDQAIKTVRKLLGDKPTEPVGSAAVPASGLKQTGTYTEIPAGSSISNNNYQSTELEQYKYKLSELVVENDDLKRQLARNQASQNEVTNLLREQRVMQEKHALLEKRCQDLERKLQAPDQRVAELQSQLVEEKMSTEMSNKRLRVAESRIQKLDQDAVELHRAKNKAEASAKESADEAARLEHELAELRRFQSNATGERNALQARLEQTVAQNKEQLTRIGDLEKELRDLRVQLQDTLKNGGDSMALNAQLAEDNRGLRENLASQQAATASAQELVVQLQGKQRDLQLEVVQVRDLLQRLEASRVRLEAEKGDLQQKLERETGASELASVELKNQRERSAKLESDIQAWSERSKRLEKRLEESKQENYNSLATLDATNRKLTSENSLLKGKITELNASAQDQEAVISKLREDYSNEHDGLLKSKATQLHLEGRVKQQEADLNSLQANFNALRTENAENKKKGEQLEVTKKQLVSLQKRVEEVEKLRRDLSAQQRENQTLTEANRRLKADLSSKGSTVSSSSSSATAVARPFAKGNPAELLAAGRKAEAEESPDLAIWNYRAVLEIEPTNSEAALRLGMIYLGRDEFDLALPLLETARRTSPNDPGLAATTATALNGLKKYGNVLALLENFCKKYPEDVRLLLPYAKALAGSGQLEAAMGLCLKAEKLAPESPAPKLELARLQLQKSEPDEKAAARLYQAARALGAGPDLELEPRLGKLVDENRQVAEFMNVAAKEAASSGDWSSAAWYYRQLLDRDRNSAEHSLQLAFAQYKLEQIPAAIETLSMNASSPQVKLLSALLRLINGEVDVAIQGAKEALASNGGKPISMPSEISAEVERILTGSEASRSVQAQNAVPVLRSAFQK